MAAISIPWYWTYLLRPHPDTDLLLDNWSGRKKTEPAIFRVDRYSKSNS